jgi:DNA-binding transcriptional ArsR family regulator
MPHVRVARTGLWDRSAHDRRAFRPSHHRRARVNGLRQGETALTYNQMVVPGLTDKAVDQLFHALADATRRDILRRSIRGELSVSRLADAYPMSFAAVQKHVAVLEWAGLVTKERRGREQLVRTDPDAVGRARQALDEVETAWRGRVDRMSHLLARVPDHRDGNPRGQGT